MAIIPQDEANIPQLQDSSLASYELFLDSSSHKKTRPIKTLHIKIHIKYQLILFGKSILDRYPLIQGKLQEIYIAIMVIVQ